MDDSIEHERITKLMITHITEGCRGWKGFCKNINIAFECKGGSSGGYIGNKPQIQISKIDMNKRDGTIYSESRSVNKDERIGRFRGESKYYLCATIAHQIVHAMVEAPNFHMKWLWNIDDLRNHGKQWQRVYRELREEFINPYVEALPPEEKKKKLTQAKISDKYKGSVGVQEKLVCIHCGDLYVPQRCRHGDPHMNDDGACMDCHLELCHDTMVKVDFNLSSSGRGNETRYPEDDRIYFPGICDKFYRV